MHSVFFLYEFAKPIDEGLVYIYLDFRSCPVTKEREYIFSKLQITRAVSFSRSSGHLNRKRNIKAFLSVSHLDHKEVVLIFFETIYCGEVKVTQEPKFLFLVDGPKKQRLLYLPVVPETFLYNRNVSFSNGTDVFL